MFICDSGAGNSHRVHTPVYTSQTAEHNGSEPVSAGAAGLPLLGPDSAGGYWPPSVGRPGPIARRWWLPQGREGPRGREVALDELDAVDRLLCGGGVSRCDDGNEVVPVDVRSGG